MSVSTLKPTSVAPWWKHRWPWFLMAGPFITIVAGSYFCYLAYTQQDALVVGDYYKQGKAINQDLRRDHRAAMLGLSAELSYDPSRGMLAGRLNQINHDNRDNDGHPDFARDKKLFIHLSHATQPEKDLKLVVQPNASGIFSLRLPMLERSRWLVLLEGEQRDWRLAGSWSWPKQQAITLEADLPKPVDD